MYAVEDNLHWEPSSDSSWLHVGNQDETYILCDENTVGAFRTGKITVRLVASNDTKVEITVKQAEATFRTQRVAYLQQHTFNLSPNNTSGETTYRLMYEEIRNGRIVNESDESDNYQRNGLYCYSTTSCGQACSDWNFTSNSYMKTAGVSFVGSWGMEERLAATGNYRTQDGRYETYINATFSVYDTLALAEFKTARANDSIYDFFYHYIPKELKCVYTDLVKIFINAHGDNYKLRKAVYNLNLFQSLIAAYFFEDTKKIKLFLDCIIAFANNYFKENDILYEYRLNGIEENGHVYLDILPCQKKTDVKLELDVETGHLREIDKSANKQAIDFEIKDNNLIAVNHGYRRERLGESNSNCCKS